jgi:hypothetical protein
MLALNVLQERSRKLQWDELRNANTSSEILLPDELTVTTKMTMLVTTMAVGDNNYRLKDYLLVLLVVLIARILVVNQLLLIVLPRIEIGTALRLLLIVVIYSTTK